MKLFLDTNVLIAAFVSHGVCGELFEYCLRTHNLYTSQAVIKELSHILLKKLKYPEPTTNDLLKFLDENLIMVEYTPLSSKVCRDRNDDRILAGALSAGADCIITGDNDLLIIGNFQGIAILKPSDFWRFEHENKS